MLAFLGNLGPWEMLLLAIVCVLVFGGRLPDVARDAVRVVGRLRRSLDDLRREVDITGEVRDLTRDLENTVDAPPPTRSAPRAEPSLEPPPPPATDDDEPAPRD